MPASLKELLTARVELVGKARAILDRAEAEKRDLNSEETSEYEKIDSEVDKLTDQIEARQKTERAKKKMDDLEASFKEEVGRQVPSSLPTPRGGDGASLSFDFGRAGKIELQPDHALYALGTRGYNDTFARFLRGEKRDWEQLGLMVGKDPQGGYLVPMDFLAMVIKFLDDMVTVRGLGTVLPPTTAKSVGILSYDTDPADADWTAEIPASDITEDSAMRFGGREMTPHLLTKLIKASMKLLRSSTLPIASFIAQRVAYKFGITENKAFLTGDGAQQPLGIFTLGTAATGGITASQDITASSATTFTGDDLINCLYDLKAQYISRATWLVSRPFHRIARKLKSGGGDYLLVMNNNTGGIPTLFDRPVVIDENVPSTFTTGKYVACVGDLSYYWIQDGLGLEMQALNELFALRNQVGWVARKETDGMPVLAEAFRRLKLA